MQRRAINPWAWQEQFGFSQAVDVSDMRRMLVVSGQTAIDAQGQVGAVGDMAGQLVAAIENLQTVLQQADMTLSDVVRLNVYTTDMDRFFAEGLGELVQRLEGVDYATTYLGVVRLALPELLVELEATAVAT